MTAQNYVTYNKSSETKNVSTNHLVDGSVQPSSTENETG